MQIHIIRHTRPDISQGICYGQSDIGLADTAPQETEAVLNLLEHPQDCVYSSPLQRCASLARQLSTETPIFDDRLKEYNFGDWELKPWNDIQGDVADRWMLDFVETAAPNGESFIEMQQRVVSFFDELLSSDHEQCAVVTHAGVMRIVYAWVLDIPLQNIFRLELAYGAIIQLTVDKITKYASLRQL